MEVKVVTVSGCLRVFLGVMALGVAPLLAWVNERNWPRSVDEQGLVTRGGARIAWNDFTKITRVITKVNGATTEHFELVFPKGKVVVATYRLVNGEQVLNHIWQRLPEHAKEMQA